MKILDLWVHPELMSFCPSSLFFDWPALEYLRVIRSPRLKRLPLHTNSAPKLRRLDVEQQWFHGLEWEDESLKSRLQPLLTIIHDDYHDGDQSDYDDNGDRSDYNDNGDQSDYNDDGDLEMVTLVSYH